MLITFLCGLAFVVIASPPRDCPFINFVPRPKVLGKLGGLVIDGDTVVTLDGRPVLLKDVPPGAEVVELESDGDRVVRLGFRSKK